MLQKKIIYKINWIFYLKLKLNLSTRLAIFPLLSRNVVFYNNSFSFGLSSNILFYSGYFYYFDDLDFSSFEVGEDDDDC